MENINERPVCHRAEDLVSYLYGEANEAEARDFAAHIGACDACRAEFALFNQVHESIVTWRNEALGPATVPISSPVAQTIAPTTPFVQDDRKLSAWAALREFFSVSPLWLRGATAFAGLLLCALLVFAVSRLWQKPTQVVKSDNADKTYTQKELDAEIQKRVAAAVAARPQTSGTNEDLTKNDQAGEQNMTVESSTNRPRRKTREHRLTDEERIQLAADLGLIPGRDEELPFVLPEEPNQ
jgi:hypothetical protein